jgi:TolB protein
MVAVGRLIGLLRDVAIVPAVALFALLLICAPAPSPARAATNGKIAFEVPPDSAPSIDTVAPDGTAMAPVPGIPKDSANPAWNADGTRLAFSSTIAGTPDIYVINADGTGLQRVTHDPLGAIDPTWSPDGRSIAFTSVRNGVPDIYVVDLATGAETRLTTDPAVDQQPRWSPDGRLIAFVSNRSGAFQIWTMSPDGSNQRPLTSQPGQSADPAWSPDGKTLAFADDVNGVQNLYAIDLASGTVKRLTSGFGTDQFPAWSPDGNQIAFTRRGALYVMPAGGDVSGSSTRLVTSPGLDPVWAPLPAAAVVAASGTVTVTAPGASGGGAPASIGTVHTLSTGTRINATNGSVVVAFKLQAAPAAVPPSTALVVHAAFAVVQRTPTLLSLSIKRPSACSAKEASIARGSRRGMVRVRRGHYRILTNEVIAASHLTDYIVVTSCRGTLVKVTEGLVFVTVRHGHHRTVRLPAGHSFFAAHA